MMHTLPTRHPTTRFCAPAVVALMMVASFRSTTQGILEDVVVARQASVIVAPPVRRPLDDFATFLHIGKGGGGTIDDNRIQKWWKLKVGVCHEGGPCNDWVSQQTTQQAAGINKRHHGILVNIRDPVDRFVSAFYWQIIRYCSPAGNDPRKPAPDGQIPPVTTHCSREKEGNPGYPLFRTYYYDYQHDVNVFAKALCSKDNEKARQRAQYQVIRTPHANFGLKQWFGFMNVHRPYDPAAIYPLVLDSTVASLEDQTDAAIEWLHEFTHFEDDAVFAQRRAWVQLHAAMGNKNETVLLQHSSVTPKTIRPTRETEQCLVNVFREDYELLPQIQALLCKSQDCRRGIQSILDRRKPFLLVNEDH